MRARLLIAALAALAALGAAAPASADVCYSVTATLNGDVLVNEASCVETG